MMLEIELLQGKEMNQLRTISCLFAVLSYLQNEPLCGKCSSFRTVYEKTMEKFLHIEKAVGRDRHLPEEMRGLLLHIYRVLAELKQPDDPVRQKKEGNCSYPQGVCLAKNSFAMFERIEEQT